MRHGQLGMRGPPESPSPIPECLGSGHPQRSRLCHSQALPPPGSHHPPVPQKCQPPLLFHHGVRTHGTRQLRHPQASRTTPHHTLLGHRCHPGLVLQHRVPVLHSSHCRPPPELVKRAGPGRRRMERPCCSMRRDVGPRHPSCTSSMGHLGSPSTSREQEPPCWHHAGSASIPGHRRAISIEATLGQGCYHFLQVRTALRVGPAESCDVA